MKKILQLARLNSPGRFLQKYNNNGVIVDPLDSSLELPYYSDLDVDKALEKDELVYWESANWMDKSHAWLLKTAHGLVLIVGKLECVGFEIDIDLRSPTSSEDVNPLVKLKKDAYRCLVAKIRREIL